MAWVEARFRGDDKVWVEVDADGALIVQNGKARMRYKNAESAQVYSPFADKVALAEGAAAEAASEVAEPTKAGPARRPAARPSTRPTVADAAATHIAYTDGACTGNPGPAGGGALVVFPDGRKIERHRALGSRLEVAE
jgi:ribonuclease HI